LTEAKTRDTCREEGAGPTGARGLGEPGTNVVERGGWQVNGNRNVNVNGNVNGSSHTDVVLPDDSPIEALESVSAAHAAAAAAVVAKAPGPKSNSATEASERSAMNRFLFRRLWGYVGTSAFLVALALATLVVVAWRSLDRFAPIHTHLDHVQRLQKTTLDLERLLDRSLRAGQPIDPAALRSLGANISELAEFEGSLALGTQERLEKASKRAGAPGVDTTAAVVAIVESLQRVLFAETAAHDELVQGVERDTRIELLTAMGLGIALPVTAVFLLFSVRKRYLAPLDNLSELMTLLSRQDYRTVPTADLDVLLRPVYDNYNRMAARLGELEIEHRERQRTLEDEVRAATRALLVQQQELSRAARLAAVGEFAAGVAHELRNPLAGVQMALSGLRRDVDDAETAGRLDMVIGELKRVTRHVNQLLDLSRRAPEPVSEIRLPGVVDELFQLVRYQVGDRIRLRREIPETIDCRLPEGGFRQALLNLILNATQAIGDGAGDIVVSAASDSGRLAVVVTDSGPGFSGQILETGVRSFVTLREGGTGLGLAIVRRFVRDLGGDIYLANEADGGARVTMEFPQRTQEREPVQEQEQEQEQRRG
jgi:two-component system, NtrC family, sensor kinase